MGIKLEKQCGRIKKSACVVWAELRMRKKMLPLDMEGLLARNLRQPQLLDNFFLCGFPAADCAYLDSFAFVQGNADFDIDRVSPPQLAAQCGKPA
jgi:hypothetical protein